MIYPNSILIFSSPAECVDLDVDAAGVDAKPSPLEFDVDAESTMAVMLCLISRCIKVECKWMS